MEYPKIRCYRKYKRPKQQNIVNLVDDTSVTLHNCTVRSAKNRVTRDAKAYGYQPITEWHAYINPEKFEYEYRREYAGRNGTIIGIIQPIKENP